MIQIYIEIQEDSIHPIVFELLKIAHNLKDEYEKMNGDVPFEISAFSAVELSNAHRDELKYYGISKVYLANLKPLFCQNTYAKAFIEALKLAKAEILLIGATHEGHLLASKVGAMLNTGITADCTKLYLNEEQRLVQVRPAFSGNIMAEIITPYTKLQIATVHKNVFEQLEKKEENSLEYFNIVNDFLPNIEILDKIKHVSKVDITKSEKVVIVGNGVEKENMPQIFDFAKKIDADIAGTKLAVQKGLVERQFQIGLSGHTIAPNLAILFGVSGSIQFISGVLKAKKIIAVNRDASADIFKVTHISLCTDIKDVLSYLSL